jgi:putative chitinase
LKLTKNIVVIGTGCDAATAAVWLSSLQAACDNFEINTPNRVAAMLANVGVESLGFTELVEDMDYSAQELANTWPSRYSDNPQGAFHTPSPTAYELANKPQAIANNVYAFRMGNGGPSTGDGWEYRGEGPLQISGKDNIEAFFEAMDLPTETDPTSLQKPALGAMSVAWFFSTNGCNALADEGNISGIVAKVNGQPPCAVNQGLLRISRYNAVVAALND